MASKGPPELSALRFLWVGWVLVLCIVIGFFLGSWLDQELGTSPWLVVAGVFLGTAAGFIELFRSVSRNQK